MMTRHLYLHRTLINRSLRGTFWLYLEYGLQGVRADWGATAVKTLNEESRDGYCGMG